MLCVKSQTEKSTSCFRTNALKDMGKIILVQAPDSQTQDIQIFNHLTTLSSLPLPNRLVVSINIEIERLIGQDIGYTCIVDMFVFDHL
jgi:hypothetical protein